MPTIITPAADVAETLWGLAAGEALRDPLLVIAAALDPHPDLDYDAVPPVETPLFTTFDLVTVDGTTVRVTCEELA